MVFARFISALGFENFRRSWYISTEDQQRNKLAKKEVISDFIFESGIPTMAPSS
jgi:hypothetical protein